VQGLGAALAEAGEVRGFQFVVHQAEYQEQAFLRGHGGASGLAGVATVNLGRNRLPITAAATTQLKLAQRGI
jgi:hypothetical protein